MINFALRKFVVPLVMGFVTHRLTSYLLEKDKKKQGV